MSRCSDVQISSCPDIQICRCPDVHMLARPYVPMSICSYVHMSVCPHTKMDQSRDVQTSKCPGCQNYSLFSSLSPPHSTMPVEGVPDGVLNAHRTIRSTDVCRGTHDRPQPPPRCLALGAWCWVLGARCLVLDARCLARGAGACGLVLGAWCLLPIARRPKSCSCSAAGGECEDFAGRRRPWPLHWRGDRQVVGRRSTGIGAERRG
jgi:hypothetical protein